MLFLMMVNELCPCPELQIRQSMRHPPAGNDYASSSHVCGIGQRETVFVSQSDAFSPWPCRVHGCKKKRGPHHARSQICHDYLRTLFPSFFFFATHSTLSSLLSPHLLHLSFFISPLLPNYPPHSPHSSHPAPAHIHPSWTGS